MRKAIVIGTGVGGLAIAIRLARLEYDVTVFETQDSPGGKLNETGDGRFRFDTGPSLFTLPELALELLDEDIRFPIKRLPLVTRYFWNDGARFDAHADVMEFCREAEEKTGVPRDKFMDYLLETEDIYRITAPVFIFNSLHKVGKWFRKGNLRVLMGLFRLKAFTTLHRHNKRKIGNDRMVQLLDRYATYNGSNPYQTPATLRVIAHLEHNLGAWLPEGGMYTIVRSLVKQAERLHVKFHYKEAVRKVTTTGSKVSGVQTDNGHYVADVVVSDIDIHQFFSTLMPDLRKLKRFDRQQLSSSAIIFYWGIKGLSPGLDVHNIFFSDNYQAEFVDLFKNFTICSDPTVYVYISSKLFADDAPEQCENWFVMVNAPENTGQNWKEMVQTARLHVLRKLEDILATPLRDRIIFEEVLDPVLIESKTGSWHGSLYGPSSNSLMSAFQRHPNFSSKFGGLYFTGGSVHPGGGIPLCLSSAGIVASLIEEDLKFEISDEHNPHEGSFLA